MDATVLLVMDVQRGIVERFAEDPGYLQRLAGAITAARGASVPVVYVAIGFRHPANPRSAPGTATFSAPVGGRRFVEGGPAAEIHPAEAPGAGRPGGEQAPGVRVTAATSMWCCAAWARARSS